VVVVPAPFEWDDVGDFARLATLLPTSGAAAAHADGAGNGSGDETGIRELRVLGDPADVTVIDGGGVVVPGAGRRIAIVGLDDVVVVDTPDALLVTTRARAQDVKLVVDALKAEGRADLT
jgi:mannose-1-phosphate guanylyltransferase